METMTLQQIADLVGKTPRAVKMWAHKAARAAREEASDKMSEEVENISGQVEIISTPETRRSIAAKLLSARRSNHAQSFTLPETVAIIRAGGNDTLANLLADNAKVAQDVATYNNLPVQAIAHEIAVALSSSITKAVRDIARVPAITGPQGREELGRAIARRAITEGTTIQPIIRMLVRVLESRSKYYEAQLLHGDLHRVPQSIAEECLHILANHATDYDPRPIQLCFIREPYYTEGE
jgi:hypothetical protein